ncbi:MAG: SAM hydrolase/SAM-dependent halogenase family protein [Flavobacteriales bacterium]|jgi:S-adenosylmethionine hydrolase
MRIVTLTSDFGVDSPYTAILKGALFKLVPDVRVIDISHRIRKFDAVEAAFVLRSVYQEFPEGSIHLICVRSADSPETPHRLVQVDGHTFIGADSGVFRLLTDKQADGVFDFSGLNLDVSAPSFPEREVFVPAAAHLARGGKPELIGRPVGGLKDVEPRRHSYEHDCLIGHVVFIDDYGNVITNITKKAFKDFGKGRPFEIQLRTSRMSIRAISEDYQSVTVGKEVALFNYAGLLEIAMNNHSAPGDRGGADALLGLKRDQIIRIQFEGNTLL